MVIEWNSQTGSQRTCNHDSAACFVCDQYLAAIIVDAAEKGSQGQAFSYYWSQEVLTLLKKNCEQLHDPNVAISCLKTVHSTLRNTFLKEVASYSIVIIDRVSRNGYLITAGDCRVRLNETWLNEPHRLSAFLPQFHEQTSSTLTRRLVVRRFSQPEVIPFVWLTEDRLMLCSDGFWECEGTNTQGEDDSSFLRIIESLEPPAITNLSDTENLFCLS
ncbi:hypothetical protein KK010_17355 [Enterobacter mori]|uniref:hypothetical protein n=1 Tax=Enterobacter mori TaxID=539813 RepID=UPI0011B27C10|nr:hypothetical protein [Enterobacter mori]MBT1871692.1 hypothetical protein [Enterobacter mori]BBT92720.1 hypothetical protein WP8W19C02_43400 [Enterobacter cloacae]